MFKELKYSMPWVRCAIGNVSWLRCHLCSFVCFCRLLSGSIVLSTFAQLLYRLFTIIEPYFDRFCEYFAQLLEDFAQLFTCRLLLNCSPQIYSQLDLWARSLPTTYHRLTRKLDRQSIELLSYKDLIFQVFS